MLQLNIGFGHRALHFNIGLHDWSKVADSAVGEAVENIGPAIGECRS